MSNNETGLIKFLMLLLVLGVTPGLTACKPFHNRTYQDRENDSIIGGRPVEASSKFAQRVIYLALGVSWEKKGNTRYVTQNALCTATAIAPKILITAAHCVSDLKPEQVNAVLSTNPWNHNLVMKEWIQVEKIIIHDKFSDETMKPIPMIKYDLAILKLAEAIPEDRISKIATIEQTSQSLNLVSIGFGRKSPLRDAVEADISKAETLLHFVMKSVENYNPHAEQFEVKQYDLTGICTGDSGGPGFLYDSATNEFYILGVTSYISINDREESELDPQDIYDKCIGRGNYVNLLHSENRNWIDRVISGL